MTDFPLLCALTSLTKLELLKKTHSLSHQSRLTFIILSLETRLVCHIQVFST